MISIAEALRLIEKHISAPTTSESVTIASACGRALSQDVLSPINLPPFRQAAMDGYALCGHDAPCYTVVGEVKAGDAQTPVLRPGEAVRIFTGAPVPTTASAVAPQEQTTISSSQLTLLKPTAVGDHIRPMGEQLTRGATALARGAALTPPAIGMLSMLGIETAVVCRRPKVCIIVTGDELVEVGRPLPPGKMYESNGVMLASAVEQMSYSVAQVRAIADDRAATVATLQVAIAAHDAVIVTGGVSVGDYDFVTRAAQDAGVSPIFHGVDQKPGKPLFFGVAENKPFFGLPGNPSSAMTCFYIYAYAALRKMGGYAQLHLPVSWAFATSAFIRRGDRPQFLKAFVHQGSAHILEGQSSAMLNTFSVANALILLPKEQTWVAAGDRVQTILLPG